MTKPRPKTTLSTVGDRAERVLDALMKDMQQDMKDHPNGESRRYSLTDTMKIVDRIIDFEKIKAKINPEEEGSFFKQREGANDEHE